MLNFLISNLRVNIHFYKFQVSYLSLSTKLVIIQKLMLLKFVGVGILFCLFLSTNAQTWSAWSECESIPSCCRRRVLTCDDGAGLQCAKDRVFEQRVVSISMNQCDDACSENMSWLKSTRVSSKNDNLNYFITLLLHVYLLILSFYFKTKR